MIELLEKLQANSNLISNTVAEISNQLQYGEVAEPKISQDNIQNIEKLENTDIYMLLKAIKSMSANFDSQIIIELEATYDYVLIRWAHALLTKSPKNIIDIYEYNLITQLTDIIKKQIDDINRFCKVFLKKETNEQLSGFELLSLYKGRVKYDEAVSHLDELKTFGSEALNQEEVLRQIVFQLDLSIHVKNLIKGGVQIDAEDFTEEEWEAIEQNLHLITKGEHEIKFIENYKNPNALKDTTIDKIFYFLVKSEILIGVDRNVIIGTIKHKRLPLAEKDPIIWNGSHEKARVFTILMKWNNGTFNKCFSVFKDGELIPLCATHKIRTNSRPKFYDAMKEILDSENISVS